VISWHILGAPLKPTYMIFPLLSEDGVREIVIVVGVTSSSTTLGGSGGGGAENTILFY